MSDRQETLDPHGASGANAGKERLRVPGERALRRVLALVTTVAAVLYFGAAGMVLGLRYLVFPQLDALRPRIERQVSAALHAQVRIGRLGGHWSGLQPTLDVEQLTITDAAGRRMLSVPAVHATVSWLSAVRFAPILSSLVIDQPEMSAERRADGTYSIAGITLDPRHHGNKGFLRFLMMQRAIVLRGGTIHWSDNVRHVPTMTLPGIRLAIENRGLTHRIGLQAQPDGKMLQGPLDFRARFRHSPLRPATEMANWTGTLFVSTGAVALPELARYSGAKFDAQSGTVDVAAWFDFVKGEWSSARGALSGLALKLRADPTLPTLTVPSVGMDWSLQRNDTHNLDYTLSVDNLRAELGGQAPLADGTPVTRLLSVGEFRGRFRRATVGSGQLIRISGDTVDLGLLAQFMRALPLPHRVLNELDRFDPHGAFANYIVEVERKAPQTPQAAKLAAVEGGEPIARYQVKARLEGVSIGAQEPPPGLTPGGHPHVGLPGAENIWGDVDADELGGHAAIDTTNAAVTIPGAFDDPRLTLNRLSAEATWTTKSPEPGAKRPGVAVNISRFVVDNDDVRASATGTYSNPGHGRGALDMKAMFDRLSAVRLARYLPTGINERTRTYLGHALQGGISHNATIEIHGDLTRFPYTHYPKAGIFRIVAPFHNGRFDPTPYPEKRMTNGTVEVWPAFDGIDGVFQMNQNVLRFDIQRARYQRVHLKRLTGRIDDLGTLQSNLVIDGEGAGPLADMLDYVNRSSLATMSHGLSKALDARGEAALALRLAIPRHHDEKPHVGVNGSVTLTNDAVSFVPNERLSMLPPLTQLNGKIDFTEHTVDVSRTTGQFLGGDIRASGSLRQDGSSSFDVSGRVQTDAARPLVPPGPLKTLVAQLSGNAPYSVSIRKQKNGLPEIAATSDLTGLALAFPAPFTKAAGAPMPFSFSFKPAGGDEARAGGRNRLDARLGPLNATYLVRRGSDNRPVVVRGAIGVNRAATLPEDGVTAVVDIDRFDADAWRAVLTRLAKPTAAGTSTSAAPVSRAAPPQPATVGERAPASERSTERVASAASRSDRPAVPGELSAAAETESATDAFPSVGGFESFLPTRLGLHVGTLTLLKRRWENVVIGATQTPDAWQANIASNEVSGHVAWQAKRASSPYGQLNARLAKLVIPDATDEHLVGQVLEQRAQHFPSVDLLVNDLSVRGRDLGKLEVLARNTDENGVPVWQLDRLNLTNPAAKLSATANWRTSRRRAAAEDDDGLRRTVLDFKLDVLDGGALLDRLGLPRTLKGGTGTVAGKVGWRSGPTSIDYPTLNGRLSLDLAHGQILKVEPGAAKLLGVLSLQSLARVATLDFDALFGKGLPFDSIKATGTIQNGVANTEDFAMLTAPARVTMKGSADLGLEQQNLLITVVPSISAGTAAVAAAVVNPLLGLGTLLGSLVLSDPISQIFARRYTVTGSWSHPQIEQVGSDRGKMTEPATRPIQ
jgi:uncharacterized protein (TIGR02099 family)